MRRLISRFRERVGDFWWYSLLIFAATRFGDLVQAYIGLWVVPKYVPQADLGAALPLLQVSSVVGLPLSILVVPFARWLTIYSARGEYGKVKKMLNIAFMFVAISFFAALAISRYLVPAFLDRARLAEGSLGLLILFTGLIGPFSAVFTNALQGLKKFNAIAVLQAISSPVRLVVLLVTMPFRAISGYMLGQAVAPAMNILGAMISLRKELGRGIKSVAIGFEDAKKMFRYTLPVAVYVLVGTLMGAWQSLLFRQRLPEVESAAFYIISRLGEIATYAGAVLAGVMTPLIAETVAKGQSETGLLKKLILGTILPGLVIVVCLFICGRWLMGAVTLWSDYVEYSPLMARYAFRMTIAMAVGGFITYEMSAGRFAFLWYWLPVSLAETLILVALTGYGFFAGILPESALNALKALNACRLSFFIWWQLGASTLLALAATVHIYLRKRTKPCKESPSQYRHTTAARCL